ncbi:MAG: GlsB/YeaQ/YmgE family stress response membrane protein [Anaerolineae bacterium]
MGWITLIILGAFAGWLAGYIMTRNTRFDIKDVILGVVGAIAGGYIAGMIFPAEQVATLSIKGLAIATLGALLVAWGYRMVTGKSATG